MVVLAIRGQSFPSQDCGTTDGTVVAWTLLKNVNLRQSRFDILKNSYMYDSQISYILFIWSTKTKRDSHEFERNIYRISSAKDFLFNHWHVIPRDARVVRRVKSSANTYLEKWQSILRKRFLEKLINRKMEFLSGSVPLRHMIEQFEEYIFWIFNLLYSKGKEVAPVIIKKSTSQYNLCHHDHMNFLWSQLDNLFCHVTASRCWN